MDKQAWLKKIIAALVLFVVILLFNINNNSVYESETKVLFLPKNELVSQEIDAVIANFEQIISSLAFCDRLAEENDSFEDVQDLPNYKRKEACNTKLEVSQLGKSATVSIKNFDKDSILVRELNDDTVNNLIAVTGKYYNIKSDLELRIIDGPIIRSGVLQNIFYIILQSLLWAVIIFVCIFFLIPFIFIKKEKKIRQIPSTDFAEKIPFKKTAAPIFSIPEEENYFSTKNFFKASFSGAGKKASTPVNLPISDDEVPDIFREKISMNKVEIPVEEKMIPEKDTQEKEYISHEATPEEVKERLNKLLRGEK
ncbi:MAG: hypothetical protein WAV31_02100 [Candidatus Moraniibacteriota bacterium]